MKTILRWCVVLFLWLAHQYLECIHVKIKFIDAYLDDVLFMPLVMGFALLMQRLVIGNRQDFVFSNLMIVLVWLYASVMFEWILPKYYPYTADWKDVIAYGIGALIFRFYLNTKPAEGDEDDEI